MKKAIIVIVSKHLKNSHSERPDVYIRDEVKQAIIDNGAIAIGILPPDKDIKDIEDNWQENLTEHEYNNLIEQIELSDGIIFSRRS